MVGGGGGGGRRVSATSSPQPWPQGSQKSGCPHGHGPHGIWKHQLPLRALTWSLGWWGRGDGPIPS